jgi:hypothetical protein
MPATNEEVICKLVWAFLAEVNEEELSALVWVDRHERRAEAVDATFESATRRYALEHTNFCQSGPRVAVVSHIGSIEAKRFISAIDAVVHPGTAPARHSPPQAGQSNRGGEDAQLLLPSPSRPMTRPLISVCARNGDSLPTSACTALLEDLASVVRSHGPRDAGKQLFLNVEGLLVLLNARRSCPRPSTSTTHAFSEPETSGRAKPFGGPSATRGRGASGAYETVPD